MYGINFIKGKKLIHGLNFMLKSLKKKKKFVLLLNNDNYQKTKQKY